MYHLVPNTTIRSQPLRVERNTLSLTLCPPLGTSSTAKFSGLAGFHYILGTVEAWLATCNLSSSSV
jgi:hypothetical protein